MTKKSSTHKCKIMHVVLVWIKDLICLFFIGSKLVTTSEKADFGVTADTCVKMLFCYSASSDRRQCVPVWLSCFPMCCIFLLYFKLKKKKIDKVLKSGKDDQIHLSIYLRYNKIGSTRVQGENWFWRYAQFIYSCWILILCSKC